MSRLLSWNDISSACTSYQASFSDDILTDSRDWCQAITNTYEDLNCQVFSSDSCCQFLQSQYEKRFCFKQGQTNWSDSHLLAVTVIFLFCSLVSSIIEQMHIHWLPEAGGSILVGILCGVTIKVIPGIDISDISFNQDFFLFVLIPPIIFDAALTVDKYEFLNRFLPISLLAVVGTVITSIITGVLVHYLSAQFIPSLEIPLLESLVYGSLISSVDPVAIISVLTKIGISQSDTIFMLVFGESLLNDGIAITMFNAFVSQYKSGFDSGVTMVLWLILRSLLVCIGSIVIGLVSGILSLCFFKILHKGMTPVTEVVSFFLWALVPYYASDALGLSGIVSIVVMGFFMDVYITSGNTFRRSQLQRSDSPIASYIHDYGFEPEFEENPSLLNQLFRKTSLEVSQEADMHIRFVSNVFARISENVIFVYMGMFLLSDRYNWNIPLISISIFACLFSRMIMILSVSASLCLGYDLVKKSSCYGDSEENSTTIFSETIESLRSPKTYIVLVLSGLRGAVSLALVEAIPTYDSVTTTGSQYKPEIKAMTCATIIFTTYLIGGSAYYIFRSLSLNGRPQDSVLESFPRRSHFVS